jgi:hypothetical protein
VEDGEQLIPTGLGASGERLVAAFGWKNEPAAG